MAGGWRAEGRRDTAGLRHTPTVRPHGRQNCRGEGRCDGPLACQRPIGNKDERWSSFKACRLPEPRLQNWQDPGLPTAACPRGPWHCCLPGLPARRYLQFLPHDEALYSSSSSQTTMQLHPPLRSVSQSVSKQASTERQPTQRLRRANRRGRRRRPAPSALHPRRGCAATTTTTTTTTLTPTPPNDVMPNGWLAAEWQRRARWHNKVIRISPKLIFTAP